MRFLVTSLSRAWSVLGARRRRREPPDGRPAQRRITGRSALVSVIVLAVVASTIGGLLNLRVETTTESFLPKGDPSATSFEEHAKSFGGDPIATVLESKQPGQLLLDGQQLTKLMKLEGTLSHLPDVATVYGPGTIMNQIAISSQDMLAGLSGTRDGLRARAEAQARNNHEPESAAKAAGVAATQDFDRRYGPLIVQGLPGGLPTTKNPNFVKNVIYDQNGQPRARWHFVVPRPNSVAVLVRPRQGLDQASTHRLVSAVRKAVGDAGLNTSRTTITGVPVITSALTDEAVSEIPLLAGLAALVVLLRFLVAPPNSGLFRKLWPLLAALGGSALTLAAFGWTGVPMSFGAAMLLPLLLGIGSSFSLYLAVSANRRRVLVVSGASAVAFGSLAVSPLPFVQQLGMALGLGVLLTTAVTVIVGDRFGINRNVTSALPEHKVNVSPPPRGRRWVALGCLALVAALGWVALPKLDVQANPEDAARGLPALEHAQYAEQVLGSSGEVSIVLRGKDVRNPKALEWMSAAEDVAVSRYGDQIRPILTAPDLLKFLGGSPTPGEMAAGMRLLPPYLTSAVFNPDGNEAVMTFGLKFRDLGQQTQLLKNVQAALPPPPEGTHSDVAGLPVAAGRAFDLISNHRYLDNLVGIVAAGAVLLIGLRDRRDAWRAVLAAGLATGWSIAGLWLVGEPLNPMTVALGSLATVTACEFTVLLADGHRQSTTPLRRMVGWACATSVVGYLALVPSEINLLRDFGITLAGTVVLSYGAAKAVVHLTARRESQETTPDSGVEVIDTQYAEVSS